MRHIKKKLLIILGVLLVVILVGPFLIPVSPLKDIVSPERLADPESRFIKISDFTIHYKQYGKGEPTFILLHGTLASIHSWGKISSSMAQYGTVIAFDRPAFGLTSRPMPDEWSGGNPYTYNAQVNLIIELMNKFNIKQAIVIGNSMGGGIAALTAQYYPERVKALILAAPAHDRHGVPGWLSILASIPQMRRLGPLFLRYKVREFSMNVYNRSWHDPSNISKEDIDEYSKIFQMKDWDRSLWEFIIAARPFELLLKFDTIKTPTLIITGDDDKILGTEYNISLGKSMPNSRVIVIPECGHVPQEECPEEFTKAVIEFISDLR